MPDDWKDAVKKMTDDWSDNLEDLMVKHSEEEFLKHAASTGVNFNLIQTEALEKLVLEDVGFVAQTNKKIGQSIIDDIEKILITKGDWASVKESVLEHVNKVFSGQEKIVIDNIGKQVKRVVLDTELGHVVLKDFTVKRKWTGNINAYSDMVAKSLSQKARTMGDLEGYRTTTGIIGWRRMSSLGGKTCELCASLHGRAYYFAGEGVDALPSDDGLMFEPHPNGYCYQTPIYDEWTGLKNLNETQLDDHLERWKVDTKSPIKNLKRVPDKYGRPVVIKKDSSILKKAKANKTKQVNFETYLTKLPDDIVDEQEAFWDILVDKGWSADSLFTKGKIAYNDTLHLDKYDRIVAMSRVERLGDALNITNLEVNAAMRRSGKGLTVMKDIVDDGMDKGAERIILTSLDENSDKFYTALGMTRDEHDFSGDINWMKNFVGEMNK